MTTHDGNDMDHEMVSGVSGEPSDIANELSRWKEVVEVADAPFSTEASYLLHLIHLWIMDHLDDLNDRALHALAALREGVSAPSDASPEEIRSSLRSSCAEERGDSRVPPLSAECVRELLGSLGCSPTSSQEDAIRLSQALLKRRQIGPSNAAVDDVSEARSGDSSATTKTEDLHEGFESELFCSSSSEEFSYESDGSSTSLSSISSTEPEFLCVKCGAYFGSEIGRARHVPRCTGRVQNATPLSEDVGDDAELVLTLVGYMRNTRPKHFWTRIGERFQVSAIPECTKKREHLKSDPNISRAQYVCSREHARVIPRGGVLLWRPSFRCEPLRATFPAVQTLPKTPCVSLWMLPSEAVFLIAAIARSDIALFNHLLARWVDMAKLTTLSVSEWYVRINSDTRMIPDLDPNFTCTPACKVFEDTLQKSMWTADDVHKAKQFFIRTKVSSRERDFNRGVKICDGRGAKVCAR